MLDEVVVPNALLPGSVHQSTHRLKLVVAREDHRLLLHFAALIVAFLLLLEMDEPCQQIEETVPLQYLLPQIPRAVRLAGRIRRVSGTTVATSVERQEVRCRTRQAGRHEHRLGVYCEMHQGSPLEL